MNDLFFELKENEKAWMKIKSAVVLEKEYKSTNKE